MFTQDNKLEFTCNIHHDKGIQKLTLNKIIHRNSGCKFCARERIGRIHRVDESEIIRLTEGKGFIYHGVVYGQDKNKKSIIHYSCPNHLEVGIQTRSLGSMRKAVHRKCPYCQNKKIPLARNYHEEFTARMKKIDDTIEIISDDIKKNSIVKCKCTVDGTEWENTTYKLLSDVGCPQCIWNGRSQSGKANIKEAEDFLKECQIKLPNIEIISPYVGCKKTISCRCRIDGTIWTSTPDTLLNSASIGCPTCVRRATRERCAKSHNAFLEELKLVNPNILPLEEYKSGHEKIRCKCIIHDYEWHVAPNKILHRKTGCPKCSSYHNENVLHSILDKWDYKYELQKRFKECRDKLSLPFDVYLTDLNILIEYDGEQHYIPIRRGGMTERDAQNQLEITKFHDEIKNKYCIQNNIPLIRIPYWERNNMEYFLSNGLLKYGIGQKERTA